MLMRCLLLPLCCHPCLRFPLLLPLPRHSARARLCPALPYPALPARSPQTTDTVGSRSPSFRRTAAAEAAAAARRHCTIAIIQQRQLQQRQRPRQQPISVAIALEPRGRVGIRGRNQPKSASGHAQPIVRSGCWSRSRSRSSDDVPRSAGWPSRCRQDARQDAREWAAGHEMPNLNDAHRGYRAMYLLLTFLLASPSIAPDSSSLLISS